MSIPGIHAKETGLSEGDAYNEADHSRLASMAHDVHHSSGGDAFVSDHPDQDEQTGKKKGLESMQGIASTLKEKVKTSTHKIHDVLRLQGDIKKDNRDVDLFPELQWDAELRRTNTLHPGEVEYLSVRRRRIAESGALAKFLGLPEDEHVHPNDVPIIGLGGSGGGYRANLGFLATFIAAKELGFWDLISYLAGVSGACWGIAGYMTFANRNAQSLLDHFAANSYRHPVSPKAVNAVADSEDGAYYLFGPLLQKIKTGVSLALLDLYSTFSVSYMWLPAQGRVEAGEDKSALRKEWFQWSKVWERSGVKDGEEPFPILTAVRHERPWRDWTSPTEPFSSGNHAGNEHQTAEDAWWQWFEFNPLEIGCDELEGWVPTWSFGRKFDKGHSDQRMPEQSLSLILGLATSAPAGPLSSYLGTVYRNLPHNIVGSAIKGLSDEIEKVAPEESERFGDHHPIHACNEPNPFFGATKEENRGQGIENSPRVHLIDSGMSNNMPTYPFTHPDRDVDVLINCDYSSDVQKDSALQRVNDFGKSKGLNFVPRVKLAPLANAPVDNKGKPKPMNADEIQERFKGRYAQVVDGIAIYPSRKPPLPPGFHLHDRESEMNEPILYNDHHQPQARRNMVMVYVPLLPNKVQPDYDPSTAPFSSSYNLVWTSDQVHTIAKTQVANVKEGIEEIRSVIREAYERRKQDRLAGKKPFMPAVDQPVNPT